MEVTVTSSTKSIETITHKVNLNEIFSMTLTIIKTDDRVTDKQLVAEGNFENGNNLVPCLVDDAVLAAIRSGFPFDSSKNPRFEEINRDKEKVFNSIVNGDSQYQGIILRYYNHSFYELKQRKSFGVLYFDYININNEYFKLRELHSFLTNSNNPCLSDISEIKDIPYYNASKGHDKGFSFKCLVEFPFTYDSWEMKEKVLTNLGADAFKKVKNKNE